MLTNEEIVDVVSKIDGFTDIAEHVSDEELSLLTKKLYIHDGWLSLLRRAYNLSQHINEHNIKYNIVFTGSIGVGKSTYSEAFHFLFNHGIQEYAKLYNKQSISPNYANIYPEYTSVHPHTSIELLNQMFYTGDRFCLQTYITTCYLEMKKRQTKDTLLNIYERLPDDSFIIFDVDFYKNGELSHTQLVALMEMLDKLHKLYPSYINANYIDTIYSENSMFNNILTIISMIEDDINVSNNNEITRIIHVDTLNISTSKDNIVKRNRDGEVNAYSDEYLHNMIIRYRNMINGIKHKSYTNMLSFFALE